jgi:hypothetical protein
MKLHSRRDYQLLSQQLLFARYGPILVMQHNVVEEQLHLAATDVDSTKC